MDVDAQGVDCRRTYVGPDEPCSPGIFWVPQIEMRRYLPNELIKEFTYLWRTFDRHRFLYLDSCIVANDLFDDLCEPRFLFDSDLFEFERSGGLVAVPGVCLKLQKLDSIRR